MRRTNILRIMSLVIGVLLLITLFAFASVEDVGSIGLYQDFDYNNGTQYRMFMNWTGNAKFNYTVLVRSSTTDWSTTGYANVPGTSNNMKYEHKATILNPGVTYDFTLLIVNASNGADSINSSKIASILINDRPTVNNVNITPINPKKTDKITCIANVIDRYQPSTSINAVINLTYGGGEGSGGIQSNVSCPGDGENFTCADTFNLTAEVAYIRGNSVSCVVAVTDGQRNHTNSSVQSALIQNSEPEARDVRIVNNSDTSSTTLFCNYTFYDYDGDTENISSQEFRWLINNEGLNEYVEILGEKEQALQRIFDQNDRIKCSVRIMDDYDDNALVSEWADSSVYMFTENSVPQLVNITDSTSMSSPAEVGQQIVFSGKWFDIQDYPETANMYVCKGIYPPEDMSGNRSDVWVNITYPQGGDDSKAVWVFSNKTGQYVEKISVVPYKFQEGSYSTYADGSFIESGDFDYNSTDGALSLFSAGDNFYDKNRDGRYTVGEPIVNSSADHVYQAGLDNLVTPGYYIPNNAVLTPFNESKHRFKDKNGDGNFSYNATNPEKSEDIYYKLNLTGDVGGIKSIVGDLRLTVVTNSSIEERDYTQNVYDFYVYEVNVTEMEWLRNGIGARPNVSNYVMIANDTDNNFRIGERNYFTFQYNTRPYDSRFLAIKMCIDSDNDGTCDNNDLGDKIVQSVSFTANNSGPGYIVYDNGTRRYNPDITFYYGGNNLETEGCDDEEYCRSNNQTASGIENVLNCSSYAQETDNVTNPYHVKVCDRPGEVDSKCSIYRSGTFYVNHSKLHGV